MRNDELKLRDYGLEYIDPDPIFHMPFPDGSYLTQWRDLDRTCAEFAKFSKKDAAAYRRMLAEFEAVRPILRWLWFCADRFRKAAERSIGAKSRAASCGSAAWPCPPGTSFATLSRTTTAVPSCCTCPICRRSPPDAPVTGRLAYRPPRQQHSGRPIPKGGSGALTQALARLIEAHGGVILTNKWVKRLIVENGKCTGVECSDGSAYRAEKAVLSTIHIKHLVDMAPHELWGQDFLDGVDTWQAENAMFVTHYATTRTAEISGRGRHALAGGIGHSGSLRTRVALWYDDARGVVNLEEPPLQIICCSIADPTRAPAGMHTLKVLGWQPYELKEGPAALGQDQGSRFRCQSEVPAAFAPNLTDDKILARFVESPLDLERMNPHFWHGSAHAGAQNAAQSGPMRPMPGWAQHRMPIPGLYQTGATTHPGGSVTGAPGRNAATVMLKDFGTSIEEVVSKKT